jgi:hypothetical protein
MPPDGTATIAQCPEWADRAHQEHRNDDLQQDG